MTSSRRVLFAVLLLSLAACHPDFKIGKFTTNEALYRAGLVEFQAWPLGQRRLGVREAHDRPAGARHAPAARALVSRRGRISEQQRVGPRGHELHATRRELPGRHAGRRRRAGGGALLQEALAQADAGSDLRRERRDGLQHAPRPVPELAADPRRRRRSWPTSRRCSRRRTISRGCTTCAGRRTTRRSSTSRTSSREVSDDADGATGAAPSGGRLQGDPLQGRRRRPVRGAATQLPRRRRGAGHLRGRRRRRRPPRRPTRREPTPPATGPPTS